MRPFRILLCLAFLLPLNLFAQDYYPGYIVTNKGDTLKGYIKYQRSEYSPKDIRFKPEADGKVTRYNASSTQYFSIDIGYHLDFQRYSGTISMDDVNIENVSAFRDTSFRVDTVFLKILRKDKNITLYSYDDELKTRFFVADGHSAPVELGYRVYFRSGKNDINQRGHTVNEDIYKKQLVALAEKYGKMDDALTIEINEASYTEMYLDKIADKINGYTGPDPTKGNSLGGPPKFKLAIMLAAVAVVAYLMFSVMHK